MKKQDFNCSITANVNAEEAMMAISHVYDWWTKDFTGRAEKLNDEFTISFGETFVKIKITTLIPDTKVVWTVTDCYLHWLKDKTEWKKTKIIFDISTENNQTTVHFTHQGLLPEVECYDMCVKGWTQYIPGSLLKLMKEGVGQPS
ncbi:MAG: SRPBCC domain-containing protein [Bacteroidota bacterium]